MAPAGGEGGERGKEGERREAIKILIQTSKSAPGGFPLRAPGPCCRAGGPAERRRVGCRRGGGRQKPVVVVVAAAGAPEGGGASGRGSFLPPRACARERAAGARACM